MLSRRRLVLPVLVALVVGLVSLGAQPKRYHVDAAVSSSGNGLSWAKAMKTLQEGLKAAQPWDEVWVAAGTYVGGFTVPVYIKIYGGFEPGDTALTQRRPIQRPTKLDGANKQRVITVGDNSLVDGFVIQNGRGTAPGGGGLLILGGVSTVRNCLFTGNNLTAGRGSAVCVGPGTTLKGLSRDGREVERFRVSKVLAFRGLGRQPIESAEAGDIVRVAPGADA